MGSLLACVLPSTAWALPDAPTEFCRVYPDAPECSGAQVACSTCHVLTPPERNAYGAQIEAELLPGVPRPLSPEQFVLALPEALHQVEMLDADDDGFSNLEEIIAGAHVADAESTPAYESCTPDQAARAKDNGYDVCSYDPAYAFRKISLDFCGRSPSWKEFNEFKGLDRDAQMEALHATLDACLVSDYWSGIDGVVWNLANDKISPLTSLKSNNTVLGPAGDIPLGDYTDDYFLYLYANTGDRDVRELLTADYFVYWDESGQWTEYDKLEALAEFTARGYGGAQLVSPARRAGMITSRWFLMANTMFTSIPRTTAAQAYRAYLGYDIARMEGLFSVPEEPVDWDVKDVQRADCASCHATLDPLTYPFTRYEGIGGGNGAGPLGLDTFPYSYNPSRLNRFVEVDGEDVANTPESGVIFGESVEDLIEWAWVAANSTAFAQNLVREYWELLLGESPRPANAAEFAQLWEDLMGVHEYRVEKMLHALIETEAYGVP